VQVSRQHRWSVPLLLMGACMAQACTAGQQHPAPVSQAALPQIVAQADGGFVIRAIAPRVAATAAPTNPAITLGSAVHFDRRALVPTQQKETPHGETR
jgi:hypothetical protein